MAVREFIKSFLYGGLVYLFKPQVKFLKADLSFKSEIKISMGISTHK